MGGSGGGQAPAHPSHPRPHPRPAGTVSLLLLVYLVFTSFWPISALYLAWVIFDWDTPEKGTEGWGTPVSAKKMAEGGMQRVHANYLAVSLP